VVLTGLEVGQADEDLAGAKRVRQTFGFIVEAAPAKTLLDLWKIEPDREVAMARSAEGAASRPWSV
jgi:hypothetical protein